MMPRSWTEPPLPASDELAALVASEAMPPAEVVTQLSDKMWSTRLAGMQALGKALGESASEQRTPLARPAGSALEW